MNTSIWLRRTLMSWFLIAPFSLGSLGSAAESPVRAEESASEIRRLAVEAVDRIEAGEEPSQPLSPGALLYAQSLATARTILGWGEARSDARRRGFAADELAASRDMTGVEWVHTVFGRTIPTRQNAPGMSLKDVPSPSIEAVLWALTERPVEAWTKRARDLLPAVAAAMTERLARAPAIAPDARGVLTEREREGLDLELLRRLRQLSPSEADFRTAHGRLIDLVAVGMVSAGGTAQEVTTDAVGTVIRSDQPKDAWERVVGIASVARELKGEASERLRQANGRMLQAYARIGSPVTLPGTQAAIAKSLGAYLDACGKAHPIQDDQPLVLLHPEAVQEDVYLDLLRLVPGKGHDFLDNARRSWRAEIVRVVAGCAISRLPPTPDTGRFAELVHGFDAAVSARNELAPTLLELLAWRPEFWEPQIWEDAGPFTKWPTAVRVAAALDVAAHQRFLQRLWGTDRDIPQQSAQPSHDPLVSWVEQQFPAKPPQPLPTLYRAVARALIEDDLYLVPAIQRDRKEPTESMGKSSPHAKSEDASTKALKFHEETDDAYRGTLVSLPKFLPAGEEAPAAAEMIAAIESHYSALRSSGPCAKAKTHDGFNFYDLRLFDGDFAPRFLPLVMRLGNEISFEGQSGPDLGHWRQRTATTLFWLGAARAHERLGERYFLRVGFVFDPLSDYATDRNTAYLRTARKHLLAARALYQSLCLPHENDRHVYGDAVTEDRGEHLPRLRSTPLQAALIDSSPALAVVIQDGLNRTKVQLARLESGLDATGYNGAIQKIRQFADLADRLRNLAAMIGRSEHLKAEDVRQILTVQDFELAATGADYRLAAQAERVAATEVELTQAKLGVDRAMWVRNTADVEHVAQHFATEAARQHALTAKAEAEKSLVLLNKERYKTFVVDAQIELILAALPQYVVELQHSRALATQTQEYLNELAKAVDQRHQEWLRNRPKDVLGFITKLATFLVDAVCKFYGLPPLGSIVNTAANGVIDLAEGRAGAGIAKLATAFEMGGGKEMLEKGLTALGGKIDQWEWVRQIKGDLDKDAAGGQSGAVTLLRGFGESVLPDDFTSLFRMDANELSATMLDAAKNSDTFGADLKQALEKTSARLTDRNAWAELLQGQALAARKRLYRGAVGLGLGAATELIGGSREQQDKFRSFLQNRLKLPVQGKDEAIRETVDAIQQDTVTGLQTRLKEVYAPFADLRESIRQRSAKSRENHREVVVDYLKNKHGLNDDGVNQLVEDWRAGKTDALAPIKDAVRTDVEGMLNRLQQKVLAEEFWTGIEKGQTPQGMKDLAWLPDLAENLIDGSLSREMMLAYADQKKPEERAAYGETLKAALVAMRVSVDIPVAVQVTKQFQLQEQGAEVTVSREWQAELENLLSEYYDESGAKAKADIERYWINVRDTFSKTNLSEQTLKVLSDPPTVTLPPDIRQALVDFDRASAEVNAACLQLLNTRNYKQQIDQLVETKDEQQYQTSRKELFDALKVELDKAIGKLTPAVDCAGFPWDRDQFQQQLQEVIAHWVSQDLEYNRKNLELAEKQEERQRTEAAIGAKQAELDRLPKTAIHRRDLETQLTHLREQHRQVAERIGQLDRELNLLRPGRQDGVPGPVAERVAARARMREVFGLIEMEPMQPGEKNADDPNYRHRQFQATKNQVREMLGKIGQDASGLFGKVKEFNRDAYAQKFDEAAQGLAQIAHTHTALAFGLQAAQSRALFNASEFRKKRAEVDYALAQGFVTVVEHHLEEQRLLLKAAQVDYQRARTQLDLARLDRWLHERLTTGAELYDTPALRRQTQKAVWRAARDAAFYVRVYNGLGADIVDLPTPAVYWSPEAVESFINKLEQARAKIEAERRAKFDVPGVHAKLTINHRLVQDRGQPYVDPTDGNAWRRLRFAVHSHRGYRADQTPICTFSPRVPNLSWFINEDQIHDAKTQHGWDALYNEVRLALPANPDANGLFLRTRSAPGQPWRRVTDRADFDDLKMNHEELLMSLNDAIVLVQEPQFYSGTLSSSSERLLESEPESLRLRQTQARSLAEVGSENGSLPLLNRLFLETMLPTSLVRAADCRFPECRRAIDTGLTRTALEAVAAFIREGSAQGALKDSEVHIKFRHLGDGWLIVSGFDGRKLMPTPIDWPTPSFDILRPTPEPPSSLEQILNDPLSRVNERIQAGRLSKETVSGSFSVYYPLMGTYEVLIPEGVLRDDFECVIILFGSSVEFGMLPVQQP